MEIIDLSNEYAPAYCKCLEEWSDEMKDAGNHKEAWYAKHKAKGLRVKLARDDTGKIIGMIQYIPVQHSPIEGRDIHYIYCVWVHGYREGVGNQQKRGIGKLLLKAAEEDAKALGSKGIAAWGIKLPFFMRSAWFKKQGYAVVDTDGISELVLKGFAPDVEKPRFIKMKKRPESGSDRVRVTCFKNGWCPAQNIVFERAKRACEAYPERVEFVAVDTGDRAALLEYGISDALFIDDRQIRTGPPPSYEKIMKFIEKRLRKRKLR
jgi:GNAT superfamily N-acetyltransferase